MFFRFPFITLHTPNQHEFATRHVYCNEVCTKMLKKVLYSVSVYFYENSTVQLEVCPEESRTDFARKKRKEIDNRLESEIVSLF